MSQRVGAPTEQPGLLLRVFPAMAYLEYRRMFYAAGLSAISLWAMITARGWLAYDLTGNPSGTGIVTFAAIGPWVLAPIGGALADRFDRARIVIISRVGAALCALVLAYLAFSGELAMWNLVLVTLFSGVIRSAEMPAQQALLPNTIKMHALLSAVTMASMMQFGSKVIGPVAGPIIKDYGAEWVFIATAILLALSILQMTRMTTRSTGGIAGSTNGIMRDTAQNVRVGLRFLGQAPSVRLMIIMVSLHCMFTMAFDFSLLPAYADLILGGGQAEYGYMLMAIGGGAFTSTIVLSMMPAGRVRGRVFLVVGVFSGLSLVWVGFADTMIIALIGGVLAGASQAMFMALTSAMIQAVLPDAVRGPRDEPLHDVRGRDHGGHDPRQRPGGRLHQHSPAADRARHHLRPDHDRGAGPAAHSLGHPPRRHRRRGPPHGPGGWASGSRNRRRRPTTTSTSRPTSPATQRRPKNA